MTNALVFKMSTTPIERILFFDSVFVCFDGRTVFRFNEFSKCHRRISIVDSAVIDFEATT